MAAQKWREREEAWQLIRRLSHGRCLSWLYGGDFTHIKEGMRDRSASQINIFREALENTGLHDLG